jgi:hypothetical protein
MHVPPAVDVHTATEMMMNMSSSEEGGPRPRLPKQELKADPTDFRATLVTP